MNLRINTEFPAKGEKSRKIYWRSYKNTNRPQIIPNASANSCNTSGLPVLRTVAFVILLENRKAEGKKAKVGFVACLNIENIEMHNFFFIYDF